MKPQTRRILRHLEEHGSITQEEATDLYGCTRLASRICELKREDREIKRHFETGMNRYGEHVRYARYFMRRMENHADVSAAEGR